MATITKSRGTAKPYLDHPVAPIVDLYGKKFADEQVEIEKSRRGPSSAAWEYALSMTGKERESKFKEIVRQNQ